MWRIDVQQDGKRKSFYSSRPGRTGQREANAKADATSYAYASGAAIDVKTGIINIISNATSIATAEIDMPDVSIGLVSIGVNELEATAGGNYSAYLNGSGRSVTASQLNIQNTYTAKAKSNTGASKAGISASGTSAQANAAKATTNVSANAGVNLAVKDRDGDNSSDDGASPLSINVDTVSILADGTATAQAEVKTQSGVAINSAAVNIL